LILRVSFLFSFPFFFVFCLFQLKKKIKGKRMFTRVNAAKEAKISEIATNQGIRIEKESVVYYLVGEKKENVSEKKKLVLFSHGAELVDEAAREKLGWNGGAQKVSAKEVDGDLFVQSTSHNRKIPVGGGVLFVTGTGTKKPKGETSESSFPMHYVMPHAEAVLFPDDIWKKILWYVLEPKTLEESEEAYNWGRASVKSIMALSSTCKRLYGVCSADDVWKSIADALLYVPTASRGAPNWHSRFQDPACAHFKQAAFVRLQKHIVGEDEGADFYDPESVRTAYGCQSVSWGAPGVFKSRYKSLDDFKAIG
jgi:hypothetical protein